MPAGQVSCAGRWELYTSLRPRQEVLFKRVGDAVSHVERLVRGWAPRELVLWPPMVFVEAMAAVVLCRLWQRAIPGVDYRGLWTTLVMVIFWFLMFSVVVSLGRFVALWWSIAKIMREFLTLPMTQAYDRIPPMYARSFGRYLDQVVPSMSNFDIPVRPVGRGRRRLFQGRTNPPRGSWHNLLIEPTVSSTTRSSTKPPWRSRGGTRSRINPFRRESKRSRPSWRFTRMR